MTYEERIKEIEKELEQLNYRRLVKQEEFQQAQMEYQQYMSQASEAMLTRKGEIIGLKRLIEGEK